MTDLFPITTEVEKFIEYLDDTLIPDLKESGKTATAEDFETCVKHMKRITTPSFGTVKEMVLKFVPKQRREIMEILRRTLPGS